MPTLDRDPRRYELLREKAILGGDIVSFGNPQYLEEPILGLKEDGMGRIRGEQDQKKKSAHYKVLVVDDGELLRNLIVTLLSMQGHQCITASNGVDALEKIKQNKFDAVIADIVMPEMDGITLTKELLSLFPHLPIMIMTGYSSEYPTELAIIAGARDFIEKPFSNDGFILRFNKMMSDHKIILNIEEKKKEMVFHIQRESLEKTNEIQKEMESLKRRLVGEYTRFDDEYL